MHFFSDFLNQTQRMHQVPVAIGALMPKNIHSVTDFVMFLSFICMTRSAAGLAIKIVKKKRRNAEIISCKKYQ